MLAPHWCIRAQPCTRLSSSDKAPGGHRSWGHPGLVPCAKTGRPLAPGKLLGSYHTGVQHAYHTQLPLERRSPLTFAVRHRGHGRPWPSPSPLHTSCAERHQIKQLSVGVPNIPCPAEARHQDGYYDGHGNCCSLTGARASGAPCTAAAVCTNHLLFPQRCTWGFWDKARASAAWLLQRVTPRAALPCMRPHTQRARMPVCSLSNPQPKVKRSDSAEAAELPQE